MGTPENFHGDITAPFGTYRLPPNREAIRASAQRMGDDRLGRWTISLRRKRATRGLSEPFDVTVAPGVNARLYPSTNRCEKRALCGVQIWDATEREALRKAVSTPLAEPFIFLDVGANVGLYSLFVSAYAREAGREAQIIAVEPSRDIGARLRFNADASDAAITHIAKAVSDASGTAYLTDGGTNRGEGQLAETGQPVDVITLMQLCQLQGLTRIHAMKIDIEGHDGRALDAFFREAANSLHPDLIIIELAADNRSAIIELLAAQNYLLRDTSSLNGIFEKQR